MELDKENPTELNIIKVGMFKFRKEYLTTNHIKILLIDDFNQKSARYPHICSGFTKNFLLLAESKGFGKFSNKEMKFNINFEHPEIIKFIKELKEYDDGINKSNE